MLPLLSSSEFFALRAESNQKVLQSVYRKRDGGARIESTADTPSGNARARFYAEPSKEHEGFVHIRYCRNNKYWVFVQDSDDGHCYMGAADEPNEELGSESCTLFKPTLLDGTDRPIIRFQTYIRGYVAHACVGSGGKFKPYLRISTQEELPMLSYFIFIGLSRDKELPKYVSFKGEDGKYIQMHDGEKDEDMAWRPAILLWEFSVSDIFGLAMGSKLFLQFGTKALGDDGAVCTIITNDDGTVHIKSSETGDNWTLGRYDWIQPVGKSNDRNSTFKVITGEGFVALQNLGNQKFCNRLECSPLFKRDLLKANGHTISKSSQLVVEEPLFRREISHVKFHLDQARIHSNSLVILDSREHSNDTPGVQTGTFSFKKKTQVTGRWETLVSSNTAEVKTFGGSIGSIPFVLGGEVTLSREAASAKRRTESKDGSEEMTVTQNFTVPPGRAVTAEFVAMQASCEVPYSYRRKDVLTNGETILIVCEDGIYTGVNQYKFRIIMTESDAHESYKPTC